MRFGHVPQRRQPACLSDGDLKPKVIGLSVSSAREGGECPAPVLADEHVLHKPP